MELHIHEVLAESCLLQCKESRVGHYIFLQVALQHALVRSG